MNKELYKQYLNRLDLEELEKHALSACIVMHVIHQIQEEIRTVPQILSECRMTVKEYQKRKGL